MRTMSKTVRFTTDDFSYFMRTRECSVLASGELNSQIKKRELNEDALAKIFLLDRKRKPSRFDAKTLHADLNEYLSMCGKFFKAATWASAMK